MAIAKTTGGFLPYLRRKNLGLYLVYSALALLFAQILFHATVAEDAYITFRTVDQFAAANGLRWNMDERVQVYTHPLWMFIHIPFYLLWENIFFISLAIGIVCTAIAIWLSIKTFAPPPLSTLVLFLLPLMASRTFIDYSTSGLENSLMHALFAWIGWLLFCAREKYFWFWITFAVSLSLLTRLDTVLLYIPLGAFLLITRFRQIRWAQVLAGTAPIFSWEIFSLFYYGFLFPNTKYAKLDTGNPLFAYLAQGWRYLLNLMTVDTVSFLYLMGCCLAVPWLLYLYLKTRREQTGIFCALAAGVFVYALYVIYTGGWHTYGRYWSLPVFASIWIGFAALFRFITPSRLLLFMVCLCVIRFFSPELAQWRSLCRGCFAGVHAQKIKNHVSLKAYLSDRQTLPNPASSKTKPILVAGQIGQYGYRARRDTIIVDNWALCDALLARLPAKDKRFLPRDVPPGYLWARKTGDASQMDPDLAVYYEKLRLITSGDLLDKGRLEEIVRFNLGQYDIYRDRYIEKMRRSKKKAKRSS